MLWRAVLGSAGILSITVKHSGIRLLWGADVGVLGGVSRCWFLLSLMVACMHARQACMPAHTWINLVVRCMMWDVATMIMVGRAGEGQSRPDYRGSASRWWHAAWWWCCAWSVAPTID